MTFLIGSAIRLMQHPMVWMAGVYFGLIILVAFVVSSHLGVFIGMRVGSLLFLLFPFAIGGVLGMLRYDDYSSILFLMQAKKHYFRIVLPACICFLVIGITMSLLIIPLSLIVGSTDQIAIFGLCGVSVPVFLGAMFYAPVIVSEGTTATQSLLRSVTLVLYDMASALKFWIVAVLLMLIVFFSTSMICAGLVYEHVEQYADLSVAEQQAIYAAFTAEEWVTMFGDGILFLVLFMSGCAVVITTFLLCYLFLCYTEVKKSVPAALTL